MIPYLLIGLFAYIGIALVLYHFLNNLYRGQQVKHVNVIVAIFWPLLLITPIAMAYFAITEELDK